MRDLHTGVLELFVEAQRWVGIEERFPGLTIIKPETNEDAAARMREVRRRVPRVRDGAAEYKARKAKRAAA
jgi:hypothetical protein